MNYNIFEEDKYVLMNNAKEDPLTLEAKVVADIVVKDVIDNQSLSEMIKVTQGISKMLIMAYGINTAYMILQIGFISMHSQLYKFVHEVNKEGEIAS